MIHRPRGTTVAGAAVVAMYVAAWGLSPLVMRGTRTDLDFFFWPAAQSAAHGHLLTVYSFRGVDAYPDANGPLSVILLAPLAAIANALGWTDPRVAAGMVGVLAAGLALLAAREAVGIIRTVRGELEWPLAAYAAFLLAPVLWIAVAGFGHVEQVIETYLLLVAVRMVLQRRDGRAGVAFGLALLARTAALACAVPLVLAAWGRGARSGMRVAASALGVGGAVLAPFLVVDGANVVHSLVTYRGQLPIGGGSVWVTLYRSSLATIVEHGDAWLSLAVAVVVCTLVVRRRPTTAATPAGLVGLLCIAAACFPMLAKTVHSYYLFEPYVFGAVWWLGRPGSALTWRAAVPALLTVDTFLAEWSVTLPLSGLGVVEGVASSLILAAVVALVATDLLRTQGSSVRSSTRLALTSSRMVTASAPANTNPTRRGSQVNP